MYKNPDKTPKMFFYDGIFFEMNNEIKEKRKTNPKVLFYIL